MTMPRVDFTDWGAVYGPGSALWNSQLQAFNSARDQWLGGLQSQQQGQFLGATPAQIQAPQAAAPEWRDEDLVGAARFYGLPEEFARSLPREELIRVVNAERYYAKQGEQGTARQLGEMVRAVPAMFAVGAGEAITGGLQRLPIIGEMLSRNKILHEADMTLRQLEESIRSSTPQSFQWVNTGANVAGNLAAMWYPATAAWGVAGKFGGAALGRAIGPISQGAFQGGASAWLLTGGSKEFQDNPAMSLAFGAGLGAAMPVAGKAWEAAAPYIQGLATRVTNAFVSPEVLRPSIRLGRTFMSEVGGEAQPGPILGLQREPAYQGPMVSTRPEAPVPAPEQGLNVFGQPELVPPPEPTGAVSQIEAQLSPRTTPQLDMNFSPLASQGAEPFPSNPILQLQRLAQQGDEQAATMLKYMTQGPAVPDHLVQDASNLAAQMNKASVVIESPAFPTLAGETQISDATAARAIEATHPGGTGIVQGVSDPMSFAQSVPGARFVRAQGSQRVDALLNVTDAQAAEYAQHGVYTGQSVLGADGVQSVVERIESGRPVLRPRYGMVPASAPLSEVHPQVVSPPAVSATPENTPLWQNFLGYAQTRAEQTAREMHGDAHSVLAENMSQYLDDFLDDVNIAGPAIRDQLREMMNAFYVDTFATRATIPIQAVQAEARATPSNASPTHQLDVLAQTKGARLEPLAGDAWVLHFEPTTAGETPVSMMFPSTEALREGLLNTNRALPDITPPSSVPIEVAGQLPIIGSQPVNPAAAEANALVEAVSEVDDFGTLRAQAEVARASGNLGRLHNIYQAGFSQWQPMRRFFSKAEQMLHEHGISALRPGRDYDELSRLVTSLHNEQHPWMDQAADISNRIRTKWLHDGTFSRVYLIEDDAQRLAAAHQMGFKPKEIEAMQMMDQFWADMFPETGLDAARQIRRYMPEVVRRQSDPALRASMWDVPSSNVTEPWFTFMREGNLEMNVRELNPAKLMDQYVRALTWRKVMAEPYAEIAARWKAVGSTVQELSPISHFFGSWMNIIRHGYDAQDDIALAAVHSTLKTLMGPEITRDQARGIASLGLNATHSSFLGYRVHVMARDALQLLLAIPRAGGDLLGVLGRVSKDPGYRADLMDRAIAEGAVALHSPRMSGIGAFGEMQSAPALAEAAAQQGQDVAQFSKRYSLASKMSVALRDLIPTKLRDVRDTIFHPMYFYGKQAEFMRAVTWEAGRVKADRALANFRQTADMSALMKESGAQTYDAAWQREFQRLVGTGDHAKAASFMGRQLADATNFKYGLVEQPQVSRTLTGRVAMQFGQYPIQLLQYMRESMVNGSAADKTAFLGTLGLVSAGLYKASRETGWNFNPMNPFYGIGFTGGPLLTMGSNVAGGASALIRGAQGQENGMTDFRMAEGGNALGTMAGAFNPLRGAFQTAAGINTALESPSPGAALSRLMITGQQGNQIDINNAFLPQATELFQSSLQAAQTPLSVGRVAAPNVPQQPMTQPPGIATPGSVPFQPQGGPSPVPGGQPNAFRAPPGSETPGPIPPPEVLQQLGVSDPSRVRWQNGALVYDSRNVGQDGRVPTHFLSEAGRLLRPGQSWEDRERELMSGNALSVRNSPPVTSMTALDPEANARASAMIAKAQSEGVELPVAETRRGQDRQNYLFTQGRNPAIGGQIHTWTLTSNHYNGRAVDFDAPVGSRAYFWLQENAPIFGLVPLGAMDPGHVAATDSSIAATPSYPRGPGGGAQF